MEPGHQSAELVEAGDPDLLPAGLDDHVSGSRQDLRNPRKYLTLSAARLSGYRVDIAAASLGDYLEETPPPGENRKPILRMALRAFFVEPMVSPSVTRSTAAAGILIG